jgi:hypothetical protein
MPWATCVDCMALPRDVRPEPPLRPPVARVARRGEMPHNVDDPRPALIGDKDMSTPVFEFEPHMHGPGKDWLFPNNDGFPWDLRAGGWVYLRSENVIGARVRVRHIGFRTERRLHTGDPSDFGPGPTIEVAPGTWEKVNHPLGDLADRQRQGYRYLITTVDGSIVHLMAGDKIPDDIDVDPPSVFED